MTVIRCFFGHESTMALFHHCKNCRGGNLVITSRPFTESILCNMIMSSGGSISLVWFFPCHVPVSHIIIFSCFSTHFICNPGGKNIKFYRLCPEFFPADVDNIHL